MSSLDTSGIGRAHNELARTARQLEEDGHQGLAVEYLKRAEVEERICTSIRALGEESKRLMHVHRQRDDGTVGRPHNVGGHGADLAEWLVRQGWTPPAHFAGRITE